MVLCKKTYEVVELIPEREKFGLKSQLCRSAVSIPSNIAEGASRNSEQDFGRFLEIALGSAFELETQLLIVQEQKWVSGNELNEAIDMVLSEQRMLFSFMQKVKERSKALKASTQNPVPRT